jgi:bifunctional non-homologous end joining protein LigD
MPKIAFEPCIPTRGAKVPAGPDWLHEIKHDGYRLIVQREGKRVRLFTRNGYDWTGRYPLIVEAALKNRCSSFVIDGEAVLLGSVDGISDFNGLHSRRHDDEVQLYAFDILALEGDDLRKLPLHLRKTNLARLLARRPDGIFIAPFTFIAKGFWLAFASRLINDLRMIAGDWKAQLREELGRVGERAVRDDINSRGGLATRGEERQQIIRQWLRDKDGERESRERALFDLTEKTVNFTRRTYYAALAALVAAIAGIMQDKPRPGKQPIYTNTVRADGAVKNRCHIAHRRRQCVPANDA